MNEEVRKVEDKKDEKEKRKEHEKKKAHKERRKEDMTEVLTVLKQQLEEKKAEAEEFKSIAQRIKAEFDNYKKRVLRDNENLIKRANTELINDLLVILDSFEHGLKVEVDKIEDEKFKSFYNGMEMIYKKLKDLLTQYGLEEIDATGEEFNPEYHEALMMEESEKYERDKVIETFQKGYKLHGNLLRPAKVKVGKAIKKEETKEKEESEKEGEE